MLCVKLFLLSYLLICDSAPIGLLAGLAKIAVHAPKYVAQGMAFELGAQVFTPRSSSDCCSCSGYYYDEGDGDDYYDAANDENDLRPQWEKNLEKGPST